MSVSTSKVARPDHPSPCGPLADDRVRVVRVVIVADVRLYREGMQASLAARSRLSVVAAARDGDEALRLIQETSPDIVVIDMATRDSLSAVRAIRQCAPDVHIVGLGVEEVAGEILACAEAGLAGYVPCDASLDELVKRIESVHRGELLCTPRIAATLFRSLESTRHDHEPPSKRLALSARERDVLKLIDRGHSNKEIAAQLHLEVSTVKHHVHSLLDKLHCKSRAEAAARLGTHVSTRRRGHMTEASLHLD